jgi:3'(2'), 5'-bisphosphate nucleotidase
MGEEDSTELRTPRLAAVAEEVRGEVAADVPGATLDEVLGWIDRARSGGGPGRVWALDPIDGTKGYLRGQQYAIALALLVGGTVQVAALACPNLTRGSHTGCVLLAARGAGANLYPLEAGAPELVRASDVDDPRRARVLESVESAHGDQERHERLRGLLGVAEPIVRLDSQAKYAVLARGEAEIYLRLPTRRDYHENVWDHAAGTLVLEEAGGRVSDAFGRPLDFGAGRRLERNRGVVATNGRLHERVIAALRDLVGERP